MKIGDRVLVNKKHWLRPHDSGVIVDYDNKRGRYLVGFPRIFPGGGITDSGYSLSGFRYAQYLWLEEAQLEHAY